MSFPDQDEDGFGPDQVIALTGVSRETLKRVHRFLDLLDNWRTRLNLIGPGEGRRIWRRHVLDGLQLAPDIGPQDQALADLGTGAGFPGVLLACAAPDIGPLQVALVEKSPRKCEFLEAVVSKLDLPATVLNRRSDEGNPIASDLVTARALAPMPRLLDLVHPWLRPDGRAVVPKGAEAQRELTLARESWTFDLDARPSLSGPDGQVLTIRKLLKRML